MDRETLAELLCNLAGKDPNNETDWQAALKEADQQIADAPARLEYLRGEIEAERISTAEIVELESLAAFIDPGDVQLLEWAGVPEFDDEDDDGPATDGDDVGQLFAVDNDGSTETIID